MLPGSRPSKDYKRIRANKWAAITARTTWDTPGKRHARGKPPRQPFSVRYLPLILPFSAAQYAKGDIEVCRAVEQSWPSEAYVPALFHSRFSGFSHTTGVFWIGTRAAQLAVVVVLLTNLPRYGYTKLYETWLEVKGLYQQRNATKSESRLLQEQFKSIMVRAALELATLAVQTTNRMSV